MSTWPTAISCRSGASQRVLSSSTVFGAMRLQPAQPEPIKGVRPHHHDVRRMTDSRKDAGAEHLDRNGAGRRREIELYGLSGSREVVDGQDRVAPERPGERQHAMVVGLQEDDRP